MKSIARRHVVHKIVDIASHLEDFCLLKNLRKSIIISKGRYSSFQEVYGFALTENECYLRGCRV